MPSYAHWSVRYAWDKSRVLLHRWTHPGTPWLTRQAVAHLASWLQPAYTGLEWGSGRSTPWLARRTGTLVSVEHDPTWFDRVQQTLARNDLENVRLCFLPSPADYVGIADGFSQGAGRSGLDFVLVDGVNELRDRCASAACPKIRTGGLLIVDDVQRFLPSPSRSPEAIPRDGEPLTPLWRDLQEKLLGWRLTWTSDGVKDTALWEKP